MTSRQYVGDTWSIRTICVYATSFLIVAFGQPAWIAPFGPTAAAFGYALFWYFLFLTPSKQQIFCIASLWYACVQAVQLSWMTSTEFQGFYILVVYLCILLCLGSLFGLLSRLLYTRQDFSTALALAGFWTLLEWGRHYVLCGLSWNPAGMALASYTIGMQMASLGGVLGLSFWVLFTNILALTSWHSRKIGAVAIWIVASAVPYLFGMYQLYDPGQSTTMHPPVRVVLLQPDLLPSEKSILIGRESEFLYPWMQWRQIFALLSSLRTHHTDLIVLPESAIYLEACRPVYNYLTVQEELVREFGTASLDAFPSRELRWAEQITGRVSNAFICQFLANYHGAEVVIGLDDLDEVSGHHVSAGLHFLPGGTEYRRYDKRILLPLAEYLPFAWAQPLCAAYGIHSFYTPGKECRVFSGKFPFAVSICYEETFSGLMWEGKTKGAEGFVNLTNDNWYPHSKLARQHFEHGRLRTVENGIPLVRASNSGWSAIIDGRGRVLSCLPETKGALLGDMPRVTYPTVYSVYGNRLIVGISLFCCFIGLFVWVLDKIRHRQHQIRPSPRSSNF